MRHTYNFINVRATHTYIHVDICKGRERETELHKYKSREIHERARAALVSIMPRCDCWSKAIQATLASLLLKTFDSSTNNVTYSHEHMQSGRSRNESCFVIEMCRCNSMRQQWMTHLLTGVSSEANFGACIPGVDAALLGAALAILTLPETLTGSKSSVLCLPCRSEWRPAAAGVMLSAS